MFSKGWFKAVQKETPEGSRVLGVGGKINDSFGKHFLMPSRGQVLGSGSGVVESMKINKTCFSPPCYSKSDGAADWQEEG